MVKIGERVAGLITFFRFSHRPTLVVAAEEFQPHVMVKVSSEANWRSRQVPSEAGGTKFTMLGPMANFLEILANSLNFS
ncbi:hypothetical protein Pmani_004255 [Petrolisthes manimaculis]|uniref:Uncharacterized protein n=1 Tax=Petrolisthes manimaculis TaxID=1843537 RepID=A0AAE1UNF2_9EUCA|nr:hypothetical protein Pmani_004255 [Petrolisthes manimaculis]